uniref:hypothetical protein n=1 Tax=Candidatus Roseilinea sp. TaxID=2838777 RepID=UPI00404A126F
MQLVVARGAVTLDQEIEYHIVRKDAIVPAYARVDGVCRRRSLADELNDAQLIWVHRRALRPCHIVWRGGYELALR